MIQRTTMEISPAALPTDPLSHLHGCTGMDWLLFIARKRGHGIEEDQCVNTAFLMQGFAWVAALLPPPPPDYWRCATPRVGSGPATFRNARSIPPRPSAPCARALSTGRACAGGIHR